MLVRLAKLSDSQAITDIYNQGIEDRSSTFETQPRTVEDMQPKGRSEKDFPNLVKYAYPASRVFP
ncbi:TPA: N-acetyltransferase family protein [Pseudomonas aeruginosa]